MAGAPPQPSLNAVIAAAGSLLDPAALATLTVAHVKRLLNADGAHLLWWDADLGVLVPLAVDDPSIGHPEPVMHPGQGMVGQAFARDARVRSDDYARQVITRPYWAKPASGVAVPLGVGKGPLGVLPVHSHTPRSFTDEEVDVVSTAGALVSPTLSTMALLARAQRRTAQAEALADLARRGARTGDPRDIEELVCDYAARLLGADLAGLVLSEPRGTGSSWTGVVGARTDVWRELTYHANHPAARTFMAGEVTVVEEFDAETFPFFSAEGIRKALYLPLLDDERPLGALAVAWRSDVSLQPEQREFGAALAGYAATLLARARARDQRRVLVNNTPVILAAMDAEGCVTLLEGAGAAAIGVGPADVGRQLSDVLAEEPELLELLESAVRTRHAQRLTVELRGHVFDTHLVADSTGSFLVATDVTEEEAAKAELRRRAVTDDLTSLPNRAEVLARTSATLREQRLTAVLTDLRAFDGVNATVGYDAADKLLCRLGARLSKDVRGDALVVGRTGGDEFAVVFAGDDPSGAVARVRASLEAPMDALTVDARCGVSVSGPGGDPAALLREADTALQRARRTGEMVVVYDAAISAGHVRDVMLTRELHATLAVGGLDVAYQPLLDVTGERLVSVEALARWTHPEHGPVPPEHFVALAERSGRVGSLTAFVLDRALAEVAAGLGLRVSVNVSALDLTDALVPLVRGALARHAVGADRLILELTESQTVGTGLGVLEDLAALGVGLAVDDFGRGWSSLELLKRVPARQLKLDRSFVARLPGDATDAAIVRAAVGLAHALGMQVVAEGVEDAAGLDAVGELGCDCVQGFHLGRPMPGPVLADWLAARGG